MKALSPALKIALIYCFFGVLWIFFSDRLLGLLTSDHQVLNLLQTFKGWIYVAITTLLLYLLIKEDYRKILEQENEKKEVFIATVTVMQHILNNFLNQMSLFKLEAEECENFDRTVLDLYDDVINEADSQIKKLSAVHTLTQQEIEDSVYKK
jgi:hypothetical protein